ncbi:hypothetical protein IFT74_20360 [Oxalobacteraceae sp. CFBP 8755]|nr:hypothetical protein [Oxalobacteraceae sp. CFBP 8755]
MNEVYTTHKMLVGTLWTAAEETCGGTMLKQLEPPDEDLAKVRFAHSVFEVLKAKRRKGETVRQTLERIILEASIKFKGDLF